MKGFYGETVALDPAVQAQNRQAWLRVLADRVQDLPADELNVYVQEGNRRARKLHGERIAARSEDWLVKT